MTGPNDRLWIIAPTQREADVTVVRLGVTPQAVRIATNRSPGALHGVTLRPQQIVRVRPEGWSERLQDLVDQHTTPRSQP